MKRIPLTRGKFALVDNDDYDRLNKFKWHAFKGRGTYYAVRTQWGDPPKEIRMHREILNAPDGMLVDHKKGNGLDNQKHNIRLCTASQNSQNKKIRSDNKSGFKGVKWCKKRHKWESNIRVKGKPVYLGLFFCIVKAAKAYDKAAVEYFGKFARTNF